MRKQMSFYVLEKKSYSCMLHHQAGLGIDATTVTLITAKAVLMLTHNLLTSRFSRFR